jgi:hypothetical protein
MADGQMGDAEGHTISQWIAKNLSALTGERRERVKHACNASLREAHADAGENDQLLSEIVERINALSDNPLKYQVIELCLDVMTADTVPSNKQSGS